MSRDSYNEFLSDLPKLHSWDGGNTWNNGGFAPKVLQAIREFIQGTVENDQPAIAETGAGNSTILFLLMGARRVYSMAPDSELRDRIIGYCSERAIDYSSLEYHPDLSEVALPKLTARLIANNELLDAALIDGGHGWPTVFVDFCYLNSALRKGGLLIVDDLQIYAVNEFVRWLSMQPEFTLVKDMKKTLIWRKETNAKYTGDFGRQPYIKKRTKERGESDSRFDFRESS